MRNAVGGPWSTSSTAATSASSCTLPAYSIFRTLPPRSTAGSPASLSIVAGMKLGLNFGYWGAGPREGVIEEARAAEALGFDSLWVAETWGSEAFVYSTWLAAHTSTIRIGT